MSLFRCISFSSIDMTGVYTLWRVRPAALFGYSHTCSNTIPPLHSHHLPTQTYSVNGIGTPWVNVCGTPEGLSTLASSLLPHTSNKSITKNMEPTTTRAQTGRPLATGKLLCCYRACNRSLSREVCSSARFSLPIIFHFALSRISSHPSSTSSKWGSFWL